MSLSILILPRASRKAAQALRGSAKFCSRRQLAKVTRKPRKRAWSASGEPRNALARMRPRSAPLYLCASDSSPAVPDRQRESPWILDSLRLFLARRRTILCTTALLCAGVHKFNSAYRPEALSWARFEGKKIASGGGGAARGRLRHGVARSVGRL